MGMALRPAHGVTLINVCDLVRENAGQGVVIGTAEVDQRGGHKHRSSRNGQCVGHAVVNRREPKRNLLTCDRLGQVMADAIDAILDAHVRRERGLGEDACRECLADLGLVTSDRTVGHLFAVKEFLASVLDIPGPTTEPASERSESMREEEDPDQEGDEENGDELGHGNS